MRLAGSVWRRRFLQMGGLAVGGVLLAACSASAAPRQSVQVHTSESLTREPTKVRPTPDPDETAVPTPDGKPTPTEAAGVVVLEIDTASSPTEFKYVQEALEAPAGAKIKLKLNNKTPMKDEVGHNWVLVKPGQEAVVLANGITAGDDKDWLDVKDPNIIAHTRLIEGEQSDTVTFDAPLPGTYTFVCTFPEHFAGGQKGTLTIK
jgi:azurin